MLPIWYISLTNPDQAVLIGTCYAIIWPTIALIWTIAHGKHAWQWLQMPTLAAIAAGPIIGIYALLAWGAFAVVAELTDPDDANKD